MINEKINTDSNLVSEKEQEKKLEKIATIKPHRGHTLFEVNMATGEILEAEFEKQDVHYHEVINNHNISKKKVITKEGYFYVSALNKKNVLKKLNKQAKKYASKKDNS